MTSYRAEQWLNLSPGDLNTASQVVSSCITNYADYPDISSDDFSLLDNSKDNITNWNVTDYQLDYSCDVCPYANETGVKFLWEVGVCETPNDTWFDAIVYVFYVGILVVAVVGNSLVVSVVVATASMRTVTNFFIVNLAIGDLLTALVCIPSTFMSALILQYWPFDYHMCALVNFLQVSL